MIQWNSFRERCIMRFMFAVKELDLLQLEFNEKLWQMTVECVTVYGGGRMVWGFRNGCEVII